MVIFRFYPLIHFIGVWILFIPAVFATEPLDVICKKLIIGVTQDPSGFLIGGTNKTEMIRGLKTIGGEPISKIEKKMKPHASSTAGFLGRTESLIDVLSRDNAYVVDQLGTTHQEIGATLKTILKATPQKSGEVVWRGQRFKVEKKDEYLGSQSSPFPDEEESTFAKGIDYQITNLSSGHSIMVSDSLPDLIERFGFYEGFETQFRLEPCDVAKVFPFLASKDKDIRRRDINHANIALQLLRTFHASLEDEILLSMGKPPKTELLENSYGLFWSANIQNRIRDMDSTEGLKEIEEALKILSDQLEGNDRLKNKLLPIKIEIEAAVRRFKTK
jgi:hypothetical protein